MPYVSVRTPWKAVRNALRYRNFFLWKLPHVPSQWPRSLHRRPPSRSLKLLFVCVLRFGRKPPREFSSDKIDRPSTTSRSLARIVEGGGPCGSLIASSRISTPPFSSVVGALPVWSEVGHSYPRVWNNHVDDLSRFPLIQDRIGLLLPCTCTRSSIIELRITIMGHPTSLTCARGAVSRLACVDSIRNIWFVFVLAWK